MTKSGGFGPPLLFFAQQGRHGLASV